MGTVFVTEGYQYDPTTGRVSRRDPSIGAIASVPARDFNHDPHSSTFHMDQTKVMNGTLVRVMSWYDNEWGFSNRMADTAVAMGKLI